MVRIKLILLLLLGLSLQQCSDETPVLFTLNQEFEAQEAQLITLELEQDHITLQVLEIAESRCPSDVVCVRFGEAMVKVEVSGVQEIPKTIDLCIGDCPQRGGGVIIEDTVAVEIDDKDYAIILRDVVPYPTTTNQAKPKEAILEMILQ